MEYIDLINNSLCKHCIHRVIRDISSLGLEILQEFEDMEMSDDADDMEDFIHISCTKLCIDLDHIVLDCSKFEEVDTTKLSTTTIIKNKEILDII